MTKSIAIIGGGIAGLTCGIYARMNGFETDIYEMHSKAGGLCTAWKRKGFTFDGCIHWLTGTTPSSSYYKLWDEIGAIRGTEFYNYEYSGKAIDNKGNSFFAYADPDKLREQMLSIAPEDRKQINRIIKDIRTFMKYEMPVDIKISNLYSTIRIIMMFYKFRNPMHDLTSKFKNPVLRDLFEMALGWGPMCAGFSLWALALMAQGNAGYPIGGSLKLIESVEKRYRDLGGKIHFKSRIKRIITDNNTASGIELDDGSIIKSDIIISAADGYSTIFNWLEGKYTGKKITRTYQSLKLFPPLVYVCIGVNGNFTKEPHSIHFQLNTPFRIGPDEIKHLFLKNYSFDPTLAPEGKCVFTLMIDSNYEYWKGLENNNELYLAEKDRIGNEVVKAISQLYPGFRDKIEEMDIATPLTFVHYTGNYKGSYQGWMLDKKALSIQIPMTLPGLKNFYMAGQWVAQGGGLPSGLITGRNVIRKICKSQKKKFVTSRDKVVKSEG